jgi:IMP dehydrogenase
VPCAEKTQFFDRMEEQGLALTYDDVRLRTGYGDGAELPTELDITSQFARGIDLKVPFVSAAMDTVTGHRMAIEMGKLGGLGVIHAAMSIEDQRDAVRRVKMAVNDVIDKPRTADQDETLKSVLNRCAKEGYDFRSFPVTNGQKKLVGLITGKDFDFPDSHDVPVSSVMTPIDQLVTASVGTSIEDAYRIMQKARKTTLPLLNEDGTVSGLYLFSNVSRIHRDIDDYNVDGNNQLISAAAVSTISPTSDTMERIAALEKYLDAVVIDTADGDSFYAVRTLDEVKSAFPNLKVVMGNISEGGSARVFAVHKADGIKVGQGPGSICTTRREIGIGMPQVTAVYEAVKALGTKYSDVPVCADGGITQHGDIPIAIAAGARSIMMGKMLAGTSEAPGDKLTLPDGTSVKRYRGMGSQEALADNNASRERYSAQNGVVLPEGISAQVAYEGPASNVISLCVAALRKGMRYVKTPDIEALRENGRFIRITNAGLRESHPHDVDVIIV